MASSLSAAIKDASENLKGIFEPVKEDKTNAYSKPEKVDKTHNFQLKNFWVNLRNPVTSLCNEVTKLSVLMTKKPLPTVIEIQDILATIEAFALELTTLTLTFPVSLGYLLRNQLRRAVSTLGRSLLDLFSYLQQENSLRNQLAMTGCVLESIQAIVELPKDNLETVIRIIADEEAQLADAAQEIEDEVKADKLAQVEGELDNTYTWTNQDRELLHPCLGLVHTARATLKRIKKVLKEQGNCDSVENIAQLDAIAESAQLLSPAVDDFSSSIYPPMIKSEVSGSALEVVTAVRQTLELCQKSHFIKESDQSWLSFLLRAVDHNNNKVQPLLNPL